MPEGPEVKLSADLIRPLIVNRIITGVDFPGTSRYHADKPTGFAEFAKHFSYQDKNYACKIQDVQVRGKFMYWSLPDEWYVYITYGMTGQLATKESKNICMKVSLDDEPLRVYFNDHRHFGTVKFVQGKKKLTKKLEELGWDPLSMDLNNNLKWVAFQLSKTSKPIAEVLMDQGVFSGVGNYIRAEALYLSKLSPWRPSNRLTKDEIANLCKSIVDVMQESYQHQGATISTYKTVYGENGNYSTLFKVYGQNKDPLGNKIITQTTPDKRTIHWCPDIQK